MKSNLKRIVITYLDFSISDINKNMIGKFCMKMNKKRNKLIKLICSAMLLMGMMFATTGCGDEQTLAGEGINKQAYPEVVRVGSLKGPTTLGLLYMMNAGADDATAGSQNTNEQNNYNFQMMTAADELLPLMIKGELDIALIPANVASILYGKMDGNLKVIDINTLGVLYMVSGNGEIDDLKDLEGQTVYLTGKGTTPDYVLRYLLAQANVDVNKINLEFKAEATEVAAMLAERPDAVGLLPQPFVTAALTQNDKLSVVLDLTEQWDNLQGDTAEASRMVTGVTVVRGEFLEQYPQAVEQFLKDHAESAEYVNSNVEQAATWAALQGIIAKEPLAKKAIPQCNIVCIDGEEMNKALSGYLQVLFEQSAESVGGKLPTEDFYFVN